MSSNTRPSRLPGLRHRRHASPGASSLMPQVGQRSGSSRSSGPTTSGSPATHACSLAATRWNSGAERFEYARISTAASSITASRKPPPTPGRVPMSWMSSRATVTRTAVPPFAGAPMVVSRSPSTTRYTAS